MKATARPGHTFRIAASFAALVVLCGTPLRAQECPPDEECTVGVASGAATIDGRPLLWKNRDARNKHNEVRSFTDGRFPYVGICDAGNDTNVWGGANAAGFCIMNSVSRDLPGTSTKGPGNGSFMKLALQRCATLEDFEILLQETAVSGRRTRANFGVVDALGGAAIFETGHDSHVRIDADSERATMPGIVVRANFATTANGTAGRVRYQRAAEICKTLPADQKLDHRFLLRHFVRDLTVTKSATGEKRQEGLLDVRETIHRLTTVSAMVFHGVKEGEPAERTTMWALLGQPLFSVAVPCFPVAGALSPEVDGEPRSKLCDAVLALADLFYEEPIPGSNDDGPTAPPSGRDEEADAALLRYLNPTRVLKVTAITLGVEDEILAETALVLKRIRGAVGLSERELLLKLHRAAAAAALAAVERAREAVSAVGERR